jgi:hypothetical protein
MCRLARRSVRTRVQMPVCRLTARSVQTIARGQRTLDFRWPVTRTCSRSSASTIVHRQRRPRRPARPLCANQQTRTAVLSRAAEYCLELMHDIQLVHSLEAPQARRRRPRARPPIRGVPVLLLYSELGMWTKAMTKALLWLEASSH